MAGKRDRGQGVGRGGWGGVVVVVPWGQPLSINLNGLARRTPEKEQKAPPPQHGRG